MDEFEKKEVEETDSAESAQRKSRYIKLGIGTTIVLVLILILCFRCSSGTPGPSDYGDAVSGIIDLSSTDVVDMQGYVNDIVEQGMVQVFINTSISVDKNDIANLLIQNSENNSYDFSVDVFSKDDDLLYKSGVVKPGYKVEEGKLISTLNSGTCEGIAIFHILNEAAEDINIIKVPVKLFKE